MTDRRNVPDDVLTKLRVVCSGLPETYEENAWAGVRWCVSKKNFAHVVMIDDGWPPAYAKAAKSNGPACVLTFRLPAAKLKAPRFSREPFFRPVWFHNIVGMFLNAPIDWDDVETLLTESYCVLAPKKLVALVEER
jgi:hypothetical protein